jgi:hypothetical protein
MYATLKKIPSTHSKDPEEKRIGQWISTQRTAYKKGTLSDDRKKKLEASGLLRQGKS